MKQTFLYDGKSYNRAIGYDLTWKKNDYLMTTADGGILSTINDVYLWDKSLSENSILSQETEKLMFQPTKLKNGEIINYGLGWKINNNIVSHTGSLASFGAYNQYDIENDIYIILFSNQLRPELLDLIDDINDDLY